MSDEKTTENRETGHQVAPVVHTPGPWKACGASESNCQCGLIWSVKADCVVAQSVSRENESITCGEGVSREQANVNGRLIAAAPELLAMCQTLLRRELEVIGSGGSPFAVDDVLVKQAQALIAKAGGLVV